MADAAFQTSVTATTIRASGSLAANTTDSTPIVNLESATAGPLGATVYVASTPGASVTAGAQLTINVSTSVDGGTTYPTVPDMSIAIPSVASTLASITFRVPGGSRTRVQLVNSDGSNALTTVVASYGVINSVGP